MFVTARTPCEYPLSLASEKAAQLYALLFMYRDSAAAGSYAVSSSCQPLERKALVLAVTPGRNRPRRSRKSALFLFEQE
uniref:hypothetical protein n=1 Tax=Cupriavidus ulmosensis TaxID=3065913 RepID=UPI00296ACA0F|nr:hypothetical protein [Cupriavidus sp. CV2]